MQDKKLFHNNTAFRLVAPVFYGILVYLMVLLLFDSLKMLSENFFSNELLFTFGLSYVFFEANRAIIVLLDKYVKSYSLKIRIISQYFISFVITIVIVSALLLLYFKYIEGFTTINTELITFNIVYLFVATFYHLHYFSMYFLMKENDKIVAKENQLKSKLRLEFESYRNKVNPNLLFESLETVLVNIYTNKNMADNLISNLSKSYRYSLINQTSEFVELKEELEAYYALEEIYSGQYPGGIIFNMEIENELSTKNIIPCTISTILELVIASNIISPSKPLYFSILNGPNSLHIEHTINQKLNIIDAEYDKLNSLKKSYKHYFDEGLIVEEIENKTIYKIPLTDIIEE